MRKVQSADREESLSELEAVSGRKETQLAYQAADLCRMQLFLQHRFLETALYRLPLAENGMVDGCGTDGRGYYYQPVGFLKRYLENPALVEEIFLHMVLHCIFQHPFQTGRDAEAWNLAADIAAAAVMKEFGGLVSEGEEMILDWLEQTLDYLSAQVIYRYLQRTDAKNQGVAGVSFEEAEVLFSRDDHRLWASEKSKKQEKKQKPEGTSGDTGSGESGEAADEENDGEPERETAGKSSEGSEAETDGKNVGESGAETDEKNIGEPVAEARKNASLKFRGESEAETCDSEADIDTEPDAGMSAKALEELRREWKDVAERMDVELQSFSAKQGTGAGHLLQNLREVERDQIDYADFLRKFAVLRETMELDLDEFDYIFYTYGMNLYGNLPLVEPLEYKEAYQIHDFVIAIDTSGSCSGETVQRFLRKTYSILKESESFDKKVNIHLIQCDCVIQKTDVITSLEELEKYMTGLELHGFGGTDFRPVFAYVEEQIQKHAFSRLEGMIYFTDGYGTFPSRPPKYRTAFAFVNQKEIPPVPPWAMRVIWDEEEFREYEAEKQRKKAFGV